MTDENARALRQRWIETLKKGEEPLDDEGVGGAEIMATRISHKQGFFPWLCEIRVVAGFLAPQERYACSHNGLICS